MSGVKISDLPAGTPAQATDQMVVARGVNTVRLPLSALDAVITGQPGPQGLPGAQGLPGVPGPPGEQGQQGPAGSASINTNTLLQFFPPEAALFPTSNYAQFKSISGSNFPVNSLTFDASTDETVYFRGLATPLTQPGIEVKLRWYADTATSGTCTWGVSLAAITPTVDTQDIETKAFAAESTITTEHLGTTGQRLMESSVVLAAVDSVSDQDDITLKITRKASTDTMTGDAHLVGVMMLTTSQLPTIDVVPPVPPVTSDVPAFNTATPNKLVDPSQTPNGTSIFSSIQSAVNTANAGDVIAVAPGTYYETVLVSRSGTLASPIYIQAQDPNNRPIIDGQMTLPNSPMSNGATGRMVSISASHIVWDSIDIVNSVGQIMTIMPSAFNNGFFLQPYEIATWYANVRVYRTRMQKCNGRAFQCMNTDGVTLGGCTIRETCRGSDSLWNSPSANPTGWPAAVGVSGKNVNLYECTIAQALGEGIHAGGHISYGAGAFIQVETLLIRNCRVFDTWSTPLYVSQVNGGIIERSVFYNTSDTRFWYGRAGSPQYPPTTVSFASEGGRSDGAPWSTGYIGSVNVTFRNNVVLGGLRLIGFNFEPSQLFDGIKVQYNTFFNAQAGTYANGSGCIYNSMPNLTDLTLENNIFYDANNRVVPVDPGFNAVLGTFTKRNNLWRATPPAVLQGTNDVVDPDPKLTTQTYAPVGPWPSVSTFDTTSFTLAGGSPALDAGVATDVTNDFFGTARGTPPDIGADEVP